MEISLCMIVKDEEDVLERCLECAKNIADEIVIVDTGSKDRTKDIANKYTDKVYDFNWCNDFSKARNYAFSKATKEYLMWLDADDVINDSEIKKINELKNEKQKYDVYMLKYNTAFDDYGNPTFSYYRERILKNCNKAVWLGKVHEAIVPFGDVKYCDISIEHRKLKISDSKRNLRIYEDMNKNNEEFSPREKYYYGRELFFNEKYEKAIDILEKFANDDKGWIENRADALKIVASCYKYLNNYEKYIETLLKCCIIYTPRADVCCELGNWFMEQNNFLQAIFWFKNALNCEKDEFSGGFIESDYYGYIPCLQLCVCLDRIGRTKEAFYYNNKAGLYKENSRAVEFNNEYFENKLKQEV